VPHGTNARGDFTLHRTRNLPGEDWIVHDGIPVTSPIRTIIDLCSVLPLSELELAVENGIRDGLFDAAVLRAARLRHTGRRGLGKLDALIGTAADAAGTRSRLEIRLKRFCRQHDLPLPEINAELCGYEVDGLYRDDRVVLEADSFEFHSSRAAFERDRRRDAALAAAGYTVVRITSRRMQEDGPRLAAQIRQLLSR
jgi:very-short-patch-repair endonuclease